MSDLRTAAQQALDALNEVTGWQSLAPQRVMDEVENALAALRAALEQREQEPVAWMVYTQDGKSVCVTDNPADFTDEHRALPLYAYPPRREWQGLDAEEIWGITCECDIDYECAINFGKDIEAALKEKNT